MPLLDADIDEGKALFEVNFWDVVRTIQAFAPLLRAGEGHGDGVVVDIESIVAVLYARLSPVCYLLRLARPQSGREKRKRKTEYLLATS